MNVDASNAVEFFSSGFLTFQLASGIAISVHRLHVSRTYDYWLEGLPSRRWTKIILERIEQRVRDNVCFMRLPIHICEPPVRTVTGQFASYVGAGRYEIQSAEPASAEFLPKLEFIAQCMALTDFPEPETFTGLIVVWHQDELTPIPEPRVTEQIERLDWKRLAQRYAPS